MKTIGLLGGMSWESSSEYYRLINESIKRRLGGLHSAQILMYSLNFAPIEALQHAGDWTQLTQVMLNAADRLVRGGADFLVICTNTMHRMADDLEAALEIPLLHIADATANAIKEKNLETVALLGTLFTMEEDFYRMRLKQRHGLKVLIPDEPGRETIHRIIYDELVQGEIRAESRKAYQKVIEELSQQGAEGVILGCTEIGLLIKQQDVEIPVFDTTEIHAEAAVDLALAED